MKNDKDIAFAEFTFKVLRLIPRNSYTTAQEIRQQLLHCGINKSLRSIQRQLKLLSDVFSEEIICDATGKTYLYSRGGVSLDGLSIQESLFIMLAKEHLKHLLPVQVMKNLKPFFKQAQENLLSYDESKIKNRLEIQWKSKTCVISETQPLIPPQIKASVFENVTSALFYNKWLKIKYQNFTDKVTESEIMPLGLAQKGTRLYLVCRFQGYEQERTLAVHRILSATILEKEFKRPKNFDLSIYTMEQRFNMGTGKVVRLHFKMDKIQAKYLMESPLSKDQKYKEYSDYVSFSASVTDSILLRRWLLGQGNAIWDVKPTRLLQIEFDSKKYSGNSV